MLLFELGVVGGNAYLEEAWQMMHCFWICWIYDAYGLARLCRTLGVRETQPSWR